MKILKLQAENIKRLSAVEITPDGHLVQITGANGQGKTSVLDAIWWALAGTAGIQAQPIRKGAEKATIRLDLGELVIERKFTKAGTTLNVSSPAGATFKSPQKMLDVLLGALTFDPLGFVRMKPRDQYDALRAIVPVDVDLEALDGLNRADYEQRTILNRDAKSLRARADAIELPFTLPTEPADEASLMDQMENAAAINARIARNKADREQRATHAKNKRDTAGECRQKALQLRAEADSLDAMAADSTKFADEIDAMLASAPPLDPPVDVAEIRQQIEKAKQVNAILASAEQRRNILAEAAGIEEQSEALTRAMESRDLEKVEAIARAPMPVAGLGYGAGCVTYNGVPLDQASSAEQLRVSVAIAMAANPKLRVIRITDGSLLDQHSLAMISDMARDGDYQVWIEQVDTSGRVGIVIEDGHVAAVNAGPVAVVA